MKMQWLNTLAGGALANRLGLLLIVFGLALSACSDNTSGTRLSPEPEEEIVQPQEGEFFDYEVVTLAPGDDLEVRALEAMITADPKTIIEFPVGTYDLVGELSVSVNN